MMGEGVDTSDIYALKKENEKLKNQLDILNSQGFKGMNNHMQAFFDEKGGGTGGNSE